MEMLLPGAKIFTTPAAGSNLLLLPLHLLLLPPLLLQGLERFLTGVYRVGSTQVLLLAVFFVRPLLSLE